MLIGFIGAHLDESVVVKVDINNFTCLLLYQASFMAIIELLFSFDVEIPEDVIRDCRLFLVIWVI